LVSQQWMLDNDDDEDTDIKVNDISKMAKDTF
jgi:hypothetical protein